MSGFEIFKSLLELAPSLIRLAEPIRSVISRLFGRFSKTRSRKPQLKRGAHPIAAPTETQTSAHNSDRRVGTRRRKERRATERRETGWKMNGRRTDDRRQEERRGRDRRGNERRQAKRCPVQRPIFLRINKYPVQGQLYNLSRTGAQILALYACHSNDRVVIDLQNPKTSDRISIPGRVVWWQADPPAQTQPAQMHRFGLHFDHQLPAEPTAYFA